MTPRLEALQCRVQRGEHKIFRQDKKIDVTLECDAEGLSWVQAAARLTHQMCEAELVVMEPDEQIVFTRTLPHPIYPVPKAIIERCKAENAKSAFAPSNICADWEMSLKF